MRTCEVDDCENDLYAKGYCVKHYARFKRHGSPSILIEQPEIKMNFFIDRKGCFIVNSHKPSASGYPRMMTRGKEQKMHRLVYKEMFGEIENGLGVLHSCDNRMCVNPEHLRVGTHQENMQDMIDRNRQAYGVKNGRAKLTEDEVLEIKYNRSDLSSRQLGEIYNVSNVTILSILNKKTWKHL